MKVLITGAFGFVGTNLSAYLAERGHELWALDVKNALTEAQSARSVYQKIYSWDELEKIPWGEVDAVVHLAGKAHDTRNASDLQSYFDVNVGLTKRVLEAWAKNISHGDTENTENGVCCVDKTVTALPTTTPLRTPCLSEKKKFILFSSVKAVADRVEGVLTEDAVPNPQTPYGQSKMEAEGLLRPRSGRNGECKNGRGAGGGARLECDRELARGEPGRCYILRPCMIHGPGNKGNLNLLYGVVRKGVPWPLGAFENRRSFASIGNVCAVVEGLLTGDAAAGVYQVADDEALSTNELIGLMARALGKRPRIWRVPAGLIRCAARCGDVLRLPLNSERLKKLSESYVVSNAKIKKALGWEAMPVRAEEGMRKTLESFGISSLTEAQRSQRSF